MFEYGLTIGKFHDLHFEQDRQRLPETDEKEWWVPFNDSSAGALCGADEKNKILSLGLHLDGKKWARDMVKQIIFRTPEKVILPYNGFHAASCEDYITFLKEVWENKEKIHSSFALFVPDDSGIFSCQLWTAERLKKKNLHPILMNNGTVSELRSWEDYIDYENPKMPFFDLDEKEFDFVEFYDFCCRKLAYIIKTDQLFPRLDCGMTNFNNIVWKIFPKRIHSEWNLGTEYNHLYGQILRLWKLIEDSSLKETYAWLPLNPFCRGRRDDLCWLKNYPHRYNAKIKKNRLSMAIYKKDEYCSEYRFLFPLVLFLGHYAGYKNAQCHIPQYNFHELIQALIMILKGKEIPELLPDIPGEEEISLEAYRQGIIKLPPACKYYFSKGDQITAKFKNGDTAYGFIEKIYPHVKGELCFAGVCGKVVFRNISDPAYLLAALEEAKTMYREYPINMRLLDGNAIREMSLREILIDSAERIARHFPNAGPDALHYLTALTDKFKNQYQRCSVVR